MTLSFIHYLAQKISSSYWILTGPACIYICILNQLAITQTHIAKHGIFSPTLTIIFTGTRQDMVL